MTEMTIPTTQAPVAPAAPVGSPPTEFEQIKQMVENGVKAVEAGFKAGTIEFHRQFHPFTGDVGVLDHHGFKAWRAAHSEGCDPAELDAVEAKAVVDPDVEADDVREARIAAERAAETPEQTAYRESEEQKDKDAEAQAVAAAAKPAEPASSAS